MSGQSLSSFACFMLSKVRHNRDGAKVMENCIGIKVDPECEFKNVPVFPGAGGALSFQPKPVLSSNLQLCGKATEQSRYFFDMKVHQVYSIESYQNSSDVVFIEDQAVTQNNHPQELTPLNLSSVEVQQPSSELGV